MAQAPHEPTDKTRDKARLLSRYGVPQEQIAADIGVSLPTLHKYYRQELDKGMMEANSLVAESLFKKARGDGPQSVTAAIFWLKARAGWRDTHAVELTGKDGGPIRTEAEQESARDRIARRIARLSAGLPLLPAAVEQDVAETEAEGESDSE